MNIKTEILEELKEKSFKKVSKIRAYLDLNYDIVGKEAKEYLEELGFSATKKGYAADFYDTLRAGPLSDADFTVWLEAGSDNVRNHTKHYDAIRRLANDIHEAK